MLPYSKDGHHAALRMAKRFELIAHFARFGDCDDQLASTEGPKAFLIISPIGSVCAVELGEIIFAAVRVRVP